MELKGKGVYEMSILEPNVNEIGEKLIKCPACDEIHKFKIIYTNVALSIKGLSLLPFNRKYTAICLGCNGIFNIDSEVGDAYLTDRSTPIAPQHLRKKGNRDA